MIRKFLTHSRIQRTIASKKFFYHENGKHDTVMVDNGEAEPVQNSDRPVTSVWFAKCLLFSKIKLTAARGRRNEIKKKKRFCSAEVEDKPDLDNTNL